MDINKKIKIEDTIDYLKILENLTETNEPEITFMQFYNKTRQILPDILYKYYSLDDNADLCDSKFKTLRAGKIYLSEPKLLNDPFDCKALFYRNKELTKYKELERFDGKIIDDISSKQIVSSFTMNGINNMLMWAHYSNNHKGFCVSYNLNDKINLNLRASILPIQYTPKRIDITDIVDRFTKMVIFEKNRQIKMGKKEVLINDTSLIFILMLATYIKHDNWEYEREYRSSVGSIISGESKFAAIPQNIYIGKDCNQEHTRKLQEIAEEMNIPIYKMMIDEHDIDYNLKAIKL